MHEFEIEEGLHKILVKLFQKDKKRYDIIFKKIQEIATSNSIEYYKNLKFPLNEFKRVHIDGSFVLIFKYDKTQDKIIFYDLDHHDKIYLKKF
ncbi:MAG: hypothetical protein QT05_C0018G0019 [archaeon GW2011_AR13]|nr:MAG: hypothetical protein QT05_C0018G0019 [archaeon GW2011_AR13]HLD54941.1 addiction module toxin RelE [Candidatus Nanoarchaeia archaeon]